MNSFITWLITVCFLMSGVTSFLAAKDLQNEITQNNDLLNIMWISVEDIGPLLSVYGAPGISTPNIDQMARDRIRYNHVISTAGVCAPSRSSIITGMYPVSIGTHKMRTGPHCQYRSAEDEMYESNQGVQDVNGRNVTQYSADILHMCVFLRNTIFTHCNST